MARRKRKRARRLPELSRLLGTGWLAGTLYSLLALVLVGEAARWFWLGQVSVQLRAYLLPAVWGLAALAARRGAWLGVLASAVLTVIVLAPAWPLYQPVSAAPGRGPTLRVATLGLAGERPGKGALARWVRRQKPDVLVLTGAEQARHRVLDGYLRQAPEGGAHALVLWTRRALRARTHFRPDGSARARLRVDRCHLDLTALGAPPAWHAGSVGARKTLFSGVDVPAHTPARVVLGDFGGDLAAPGARALLERARLHDTRLGHGRNATTPAWLGAFGIARDHILVGGWVSVLARSSDPELEGAPRRPAIAELQITTPACTR